MSKQFEGFYKTYKEILIEALSDDKLDKFHDICNKGYVKAEEELIKRDEL